MTNSNSEYKISRARIDTTAKETLHQPKKKLFWKLPIQRPFKKFTWDGGADLEETLFRRQPWADAQKSLLLFLLFLLREIV